MRAVAMPMALNLFIFSRSVNTERITAISNPRELKIGNAIEPGRLVNAVTNPRLDIALNIPTINPLRKSALIICFLFRMANGSEVKNAVAYTTK